MGGGGCRASDCREEEEQLWTPRLTWFKATNASNTQFGAATLTTFPAFLLFEHKWQKKEKKRQDYFRDTSNTCGVYLLLFISMIERPSYSLAQTYPEKHNHKVMLTQKTLANIANNTTYTNACINLPTHTQ